MERTNSLEAGISLDGELTEVTASVVDETEELQAPARQAEAVRTDSGSMRLVWPKRGAESGKRRGISRTSFSRMRLEPQYQLVAIDTTLRLRAMLAKGTTLLSDLLSDVFWGENAVRLCHNDRLAILACAIEDAQAHLSRTTGQRLLGRPVPNSDMILEIR